jgi:hypothetical protein
MPSIQWEFADEDVCPVRDELLGELYRANDLFLPGFVSALAPDIKASLALFCYRRSHLYTMGLAIAASCDEYNLVKAGGSVGAFLFSSSRAESGQLAPPRRVSSRRNITLATTVIRAFALDNELPRKATHKLRPLPSPSLEIVSD